MQKTIKTFLFSLLLTSTFLTAQAEVDSCQKIKEYTFYGENFFVVTNRSDEVCSEDLLAILNPQRLETDTYTMELPSLEWVILDEEELGAVREEISASISIKNEMQRSFTIPVAGYKNIETGDYFLIKHSLRYFDNYTEIEKEFSVFDSKDIKDSVDRKISPDRNLDIKKLSRPIVDRNKNRMIADADTTLDGKRVLSKNVMFFGNNKTVSVSFYATNKEISGDFQTIIDEFKWREGEIFTERKSKKSNVYETFLINGFVGAITVAILSFFVRRKK